MFPPFDERYEIDGGSPHDSAYYRLFQPRDTLEPHCTLSDDARTLQTSSPMPDQSASISMDRLSCRAVRFTWRMDGMTSRSGGKRARRANVLAGG